MWELMIGAALVSGIPSMSYNSDTEDPKVERSAREFRMQIYNSFRNNRTEYDSRFKQGQLALQKWRKAGRPASLREEIITWFNDARVASNERQIAPLPELPDFSSVRLQVSAALEEAPPLDRLEPEKPFELKRNQVSIEPPRFNTQPTPVELNPKLQVPEQAENPWVFRSLSQAMWKATLFTTLSSQSNSTN